MRNEEFRQIAHSGGQITIKTITQSDGRRLYQLTFQHNRIGGVGFFAVHVIPPGLPVATAQLGGIGSPIDQGPVPGNLMVYVVTDSEMMWGAECPRCSAYWRSKSPSKCCVSCGLRGEPHLFLTKAHSAYIQRSNAHRSCHGWQRKHSWGDTRDQKEASAGVGWAACDGGSDRRSARFAGR